MKKEFRIRDIGDVLKQTYKEWNENDPFDLSAVVAYYAILSMPALLIIIINVAGLVLGRQAVEGKIAAEVGNLLGSDTGLVIQNMIANASEKGSTLLGAAIGLGTLIFGATGVFIALQKALNRVWRVRIKPKSGLKKIVLSRMVSFMLIILMGFLILVFFAITTALGAFSDWLERIVPGFVVNLLFLLNFIVSFAILTVLFALIYKLLPDVRIEWKSVWLGASVTSFLFVLGKFALGFYFAHANPTSAYGAAGSLILIMLWISYSSLILFFGAEFTHVYTKKYGYKIRYNSYTIKMSDYYTQKDAGY